MNFFFFGMGYSSQAAARAIFAHDPDAIIAGTSRTLEGAAALTRHDISAHVFDGTAPGHTLGTELRNATHVVLSIAPDEGGDPALLQHRVDLDAAGNLEWLCYYSTIGVYGDFGGAWIDETAPLVPRNARSDRRVVAEQAWRDYAAERGIPLAVLRLAGIYGPGRSAFDKLVDGTSRRIVKPGQVFNRIHVADIGRITALAAEQRLAGTFNITDDEPAAPQDVIAHAAAMLSLPAPPELAFETADLTPMQRSFYADNKRVSNAAIKSALGIDLLFPNYRDGLADCLARRS